MRGLHEQSPQARVAALADAELWRALPRVALPRHEPEVGPHLPVLREAPRVLDRQHERERGDRPHAGDLAQRPGLGVGLAQRLDPPPGRRDARGQLANRLHQRQQRRPIPSGMWLAILR